MRVFISQPMKGKTKEEIDAFTGLLFLSIVLMLCNFWFSVSPACTGSNHAGTSTRSGTDSVSAGSMNTVATGEAAFSI